MRVTNASTYRNYTTSVNNVHANLNKSLNKISSGREYENAAENPTAYYRGKSIDREYQDLLSKSTLITDVKARLELQEDGAYDIQNLLATARKTIIKARTGTTTGTAMETLRDDLLRMEHNMVNDLQSQYQDFYVYGGNDVSTPPFSLSNDGMTLTYSHVFPGEDEVTNFVMELTEQKDGQGEGTGIYKFELQTDATNNPNATPERLVQAMTEQGYMDLGYGDIRDRSTLIDTYTGGLNILTGLTSDAVISSTATFSTAPGSTDYADYVNNTVMQKLTDGPLGLVAQSVMSMNNYLGQGKETANKPDLVDDRDKLDDDFARLMDMMETSEHTTTTVYSDLGNKYKTLEDTDTRLKNLQDSLTVQYKDILGADPYGSILEMYNNQYAYNAALQVGSNLMTSSLFDFVR